MQTGRKPKPVQLKLIQGNPGHRPINLNEPKIPSSKNVPKAPAHLLTEAKIEWKRVAKGLHANGLLTIVDLAALAAYCQAYGRWVRAEAELERMTKANEILASIPNGEARNAVETTAGGHMMWTTNGNLVQNPLIGIANKAMADMMRYATEFGMTPSARSRIHAKPPEAAGVAEKYFNR